MTRREEGQTGGVMVITLRIWHDVTTQSDEAYKSPRMARVIPALRISSYAVTANGLATAGETNPASEIPSSMQPLALIRNISNDVLESCKSNHEDKTLGVKHLAAVENLLTVAKFFLYPIPSLITMI